MDFEREVGKHSHDSEAGAVAQRFREVELTGTKMTSILKAEIAMFPIILLASFGFWAIFWNTSALPSNAFPYAQKFWPIQAQMQSVIQQINETGARYAPVLLAGFSYGAGLVSLISISIALVSKAVAKLPY